MKKSIYIYNNGTMQRKDNSLQFVSCDGDKRYIPIETIDEIYIMSELDFNRSLINILAQQGIVVHFFNYYDYYIGSFYPREKFISGKLLVKQVEHYSYTNKRIAIAKKFIEAAADNIYRNLRYYNSRGKDVSDAMAKINEIKKNISNSMSISELMGYEGNIRKTYYSAWNIIIDQEINFEKRVKNPPDNMINTMISFVNTLVYTKTLSEIYQTQLNPTISFLHEPGVRRFSLSLDISEIFKPILADRLIFSLLNRNQITEKSFTKELNFLHLKSDASKLIVSELDSKLKTTIKHKELNRDVSYQHLIKLECYKLIKHIFGEKEYEPFKIWW